MKKLDLKSTSVADLQKQKAEKSAELQKMRFNVSGRAKNHGMKELRRDVARINTELTAREGK